MYLNSSNIQEEKTEEITTVKKTCITDTNREVMTSQKTKFAKLWDSSRKDKMKNVHLLKISLLVQIVGIYAPLCDKDLCRVIRT